MDRKPAELNGIDKASVLMASLGAAASAKVFEQLTPRERELLGSHIAKLRNVDPEVRKQVIQESHRALQNSGADVQCSDVPFKWIEQRDSQEVAQALNAERPAIAALVLTRLAPTFAADVMARMDPKKRNQAAVRLMGASGASSETVKAADEAMRKRLGCVSAKRGLLGILTGGRKGSTADAKPEFEVGSSFDSRAGAPVLTLEDLTDLMDMEVKLALREIDPVDLAKTLSIVSENVKKVVLENLPKSAAQVVLSALDSPGQVKLRDIDAAQERITAVLRRLSDEGRIGKSSVREVVVG